MNRPGNQFFNFLLIFLQLAIIKSAHGCLPGFEGPKTVDIDDYCYKKKEPETFRDKYKSCLHNKFTQKLYTDMDIEKPGGRMWIDYKTAYPGGPFIDWSYTDNTGNLLKNSLEINLEEVKNYTEDLCTVLDPVKDLTAVSCNEKYYRYCIIQDDFDSEVKRTSLTLALDGGRMKLTVSNPDGKATTDLTVDDIYCFADSSQYYPMKVDVTQDKDTFILSLSESGYYWCTHINTLYNAAAESDKVLYIKEPIDSLRDLYSVKIKTNKAYTLDLVEIRRSLNTEWTTNLKEYVYYNTKYRESHVEPYDIETIKTFKTKSPDPTYTGLDIIKDGDTRLKRLYLDAHSVLLHVRLSPGMKPVEPGSWGDITVLYMKPVYHCGDDFTLGMNKTEPVICKLSKCVGDFNEGVKIEEGDDESCTLPTPQRRIDYTLNNLTDLLGSSKPITINAIEKVFNQPGGYVELVIAQLKEFLNSSGLVRVEDFKNVFTQVDNILSLEGMDYTNQFLNVLDNVSSKIDLNGSSIISTVKSNIALLVADTKPGKPIVFRVAARDSESFKQGSISMIDSKSEYLSTDESELVVSLPTTLSTSKQRVSFMVFRDSRAFKESRGHHVVNSRVISVKVENFTKFPAGQTIDIHLKPLKHINERNENRTCAFWKFNKNNTGSWSQEGCDFIRAEKEGQLDICRCGHLTHFAEIFVHTGFPVYIETALEELSLAGCYMSIIGILLIGVSAATLRSWRRDFQNKIWIQLSISILLLIIAFLIVVFARFQDNSIFCILAGVLLHYSVLSSFCWMFVAAVVSYRKLVAVFSQGPSHKLLRAAAFAWGTPLIILAILFSVVPHSYSGKFESNSPSGAFCYPSGLTLWLTVHTPITLLILLNLTLLVLILRSVFASNKFNKQNDGDALRMLITSCFLVFLFGLPWMFGLFSYSIVCAFLFTIFGTFQGVVLFFLFVCNKKSRDLWLIRLKLKGKHTAATMSTDINKSRATNVPLGNLKTEASRPFISN